MVPVVTLQCRNTGCGNVVAELGVVGKARAGLHRQRKLPVCGYTGLGFTQERVAQFRVVVTYRKVLVTMVTKQCRIFLGVESNTPRVLLCETSGLNAAGFTF